MSLTEQSGGIRILTHRHHQIGQVVTSDDKCGNHFIGILPAQQLLLGQEQCLPVTGQCRQVIALGKVVIRQPGMLPPLGHGILSRHL